MCVLRQGEKIFSSTAALLSLFLYLQETATVRGSGEEKSCLLGRTARIMQQLDAVDTKGALGKETTRALCISTNTIFVFVM